MKTRAAEVSQSGLRGRGAAGFPAGIMWQTVAAAAGPRKYIVGNADEGDSGTLSDRMAIEGDPFALTQGMAIAAQAVGADQGYIYVRSGLAMLPQMRNAPKAGHSREANIALLEDLCETLKFGSPCALGGFTPYPELSALKHWPEDFR